MEKIKSIIEISALIARQMTGNLSESEKELLDRWLQSSKRNQALYRKIRDSKNLSERNAIYRNVDVDGAWNNMSGRMANRFGRRSPRLIYLRYAAAVLLLVGISVASLFILNQKHELNQFASTSGKRSENTELILANGKKVEIESKQSKITYDKDGSSVLLNDSSKLEQSPSGSERSYNEIIVPFGKRSSILLSDGSQVWLNSGSRLVFPPVFDGNTREVFLEGEACFEVSKNKSKPFFVRTDAFRVKVLGTKFVVQAYKTGEEYSTVLLEGSVNLALNDKLLAKEYKMVPNQRASFNSGLKEFEITTVTDVENYIAWIDGYLIFENEDLVSLARRISRYYNVNIVVETQEETLRFSGKLDLKETPDRILNNISTIFKTKYEKRGADFLFYK